MMCSAPVEIEVIGHHRLLLRGQLSRQREIKGLDAPHRLARFGDGRQAEGEPGFAKRVCVFQVGQIELDLAIEGDDGAVEKVRVANLEVRQRRKRLRIELGDEAEHIGLDVIHLDGVAELEAVGLDAALLEALEGRGNLDAVVGIGFVSHGGDIATVDVKQIGDLAEGIGKFPRLIRQCDERVGGNVGREELPQAEEPTRGNALVAEAAGESTTAAQ